MDKFEYELKVEQIEKLIGREDFSTAKKIADTMEWKREKDAKLLTHVAELYAQAGDIEKALKIYNFAYNASSRGLLILERMTELALIFGQLDLAQELCEEYRSAGAYDADYYLFQFQIAESRGEELEKKISYLERYCNSELDEEALYRLAWMYDRAGCDEDCVRICDYIIDFFCFGESVDNAIALKKNHAPLTKYQERRVTNAAEYEQNYLRYLETLEKEERRERTEQRHEEQIRQDALMEAQEDALAKQVSEIVEQNALEKQEIHLETLVAEEELMAAFAFPTEAAGEQSSMPLHAQSEIVDSAEGAEAEIEAEAAEEETEPEVKMEAAVELEPEIEAEAAEEAEPEIEAEAVEEAEPEIEAEAAEEAEPEIEAEAVEEPESEMEAEAVGEAEPEVEEEAAEEAEPEPEAEAVEELQPEIEEEAAEEAEPETEAEPEIEAEAAEEEIEEELKPVDADSFVDTAAMEQIISQLLEEPLKEEPSPDVLPEREPLAPAADETEEASVQEEATEALVPEETAAEKDTVEEPEQHLEVRVRHRTPERTSALAALDLVVPEGSFKVVCSDTEMGVKYALELVRMVPADERCDHVAKISGRQVNKVKFSAIERQLDNDILMITNAGQLTNGALESIYTWMKKSMDNRVILVDDQNQLDGLEKRKPKLMKRFSGSYVYEKKDTQEWLELVDSYVDENDCVLDSDAYQLFEAYLSDKEEKGDVVLGVNLKDAVQDAVRQATKFSFSNIMASILDTKYDEDGLLILRDRHFL